MDYRSNRILRVAVPLKSLVQRFMYVGLVVFCFGLRLAKRSLATGKKNRVKLPPSLSGRKIGSICYIT